MILTVKVLFNADDFGLTKSITDGIIHAHTNGVVNSATLMMNGKAVTYAVERAKQNPNLKIGIHLVLTWGKPIAPNVPTLTDEEGNFVFTSILEEEPDIDAVKQEWTAQIEAFLQTGLPLHHIDSHHHVHGWEPLKEVVTSLALEYDVPCRFMPSLANTPEILLTETLWDGFYAEGVHKNIFDDLQKLNTKTVEVMTHPSYIDDELRAVSSYVEKREEELNILTTIKVPDWVTLL